VTPPRNFLNSIPRFSFYSKLIVFILFSGTQVFTRIPTTTKSRSRWCSGRSRVLLLRSNLQPGTRPAAPCCKGRSQNSTKEQFPSLTQNSLFLYQDFTILGTTLRTQFWRASKATRRDRRRRGTNPSARGLRCPSAAP